MSLNIQCSETTKQAVYKAVAALHDSRCIKHMSYAQIASVAKVSDTMARLALQQLVDEKRIIRVRVNVDEKRVSRYYYIPEES